MGEPFVGEIRIVGFNFAPQGWAFCDGSLQSIAQNSTLFNLIGTTFGGDGVITFALPNLQGRMPVHQGTGSSGTPYIIGQLSGVETVTLLTTQIPAHTHAAVCSDTATSAVPGNNLWAAATGDAYSNGAPGQAMNAAAIGLTGNNLPHDNMPPFLAVNFVISLLGIFPSQ